MRAPKIGIVPLIDAGRESYWMLPGYMEGVTRAGGLPVMLPLTEDPALLRQLAEELEGFLFPGGQDVSPALYGEEDAGLCGELCPGRDAMERLLLPMVLELDKPVLGICRGIQIINALLGGTLYQDLLAQRPSPVEHHQQPPYDQPAHPVELPEGTPLRSLLGRESIPVNSCHHQAIRALAPGLLPMALAADGVVEAVYAPDRRYLWAVQWHPEFFGRENEVSQAIFRSLTDAAR